MVASSPKEAQEEGDEDAGEEGHSVGWSHKKLLLAEGCRVSDRGVPQPSMTLVLPKAELGSFFAAFFSKFHLFSLLKAPFFGQAVHGGSLCNSRQSPC